MKDDMDQTKQAAAHNAEKRISIKRISEGAKNIIDKAGVKENK